MRRMLLSFALAVLCAAPVSAQILNGDFTTSLASWTTSSTGPTVSHHPSNGNPGGAAYIFYNWGGGGASLEQAFTCGSSHGTSSCAVTLDYQYYVLGGAAVQVTIEIDNTVAYSATHAAENPVWQTIPLAVPCGNHVLEAECEHHHPWQLRQLERVRRQRGRRMHRCRGRGDSDLGRDQGALQVSCADLPRNRSPINARSGSRSTPA
ncbi:MAG: hypothetical protein IPG61_03520 [bacterium]|nr:hypothetical protein [bacterium]